MSATINSEGPKIEISGTPTTQDLPNLSAVLNKVISKKGYRDLTLSFADIESVFQSFMVPLIALIRKYKSLGADFFVVPPVADIPKSLFYNANWSHFIDPLHHEKTEFSGTQHIPASVFKNHDEQYELAESILEVILRNLSIDRRSLAAFEWAINEIMDNVLNHANSPFGGVVQATTFSGHVVEFVVADAGIGIPRSLGEQNDVRALERAIQEGVTRNSSTNAGNGLFGTFEMAKASNGAFQIQSRSASLFLRESGNCDVKRTSAFFPGTLVVVRINCSDTELISNALKFKGKTHTPAFDYIERHLDEEQGILRLKMTEETNSFGSRAAAKPLLNKILNLLSSDEVQKLSLDFDGVYVVTSSFADEVFGRLFVQLGPLDFMRRISFENMDPIVSGLIDRAILQRS